MKVWHIVSNRWFSAITAYCINAARALRSLGCFNHITALEGSPALRHANEHRIDATSTSSFSLMSIPHFFSLFQKLNPDCIIVYGGPEEVILKIATATSKVPVHRFLGTSDSNWLRRRCPQLSSWGVKSYLVPNREIENKLHGRIGDRKSIHLVQFGADHEAFTPKTQGETHLGNIELLIFGRFDPIKGHLPFFEIFKRLLDDWDKTYDSSTPRPFLKVAGLEANLCEKDLVAGAAYLGLKREKDYDIINQKFPNAAAVISSSSIGVISSTGSEDICRVAVEFLLCGIPIFVSGCGALQETLFPNAGKSYKGKSSRDAARALRILCESSTVEKMENRDERVSTARRFFSLPAMGRGLLDAIEEPRTELAE